MYPGVTSTPPGPKYLKCPKCGMAPVYDDSGCKPNFKVPGLYRVFLLFNHARQAYTADFTINVGA